MRTLSMLKIRVSIFVSTLALALVSSAMPAQAPSPRAKVNVPFAFQLGSAHFAAGTYTLSNPQEHMLYVQSRNHSAFAMSSLESTRTPTRVSKVIFHRYGNQYFLREVWMRGEADYQSFPTSKAEQQAKRSQSGNERAALPDTTNGEVALLEIQR